MAVTSTIEYCTDRQVQDIWSISQHDTKRRIYNWTGPSTNVYTAYNTGLVTVLFADGVDLGTEDGSLSSDGHWRYVEADDKVEYYNDGGAGVAGADPNTMVMEGGEDWAALKTRIRRKASRLIESRLDFRMAREVVKDREGNYPEIIIHATAMQCVLLHLKASDPNNEVIEPFQNDLNEIIEGLSSGRIVLPTAISVDSSKGVIREVTVGANTDLRPVELRGNYSGDGYELLKVIIDSSTNTIIGTATFSVYKKSSTSMKVDQVVKSETINGDFQSLGVGSLYIRWGGDHVTLDGGSAGAAKVTINDEYEIELWGEGLESSIPSAWSVEATRQ